MGRVPKLSSSFRRRLCLVVAVCVALTTVGVTVPVAVPEAEAAGAPDPLFAGDGYAAVGSGIVNPGRLAIGPNDEIVVVMTSSPGSPGVFDFPLLRVERLLADGTPDPGFGTNGVADIALRPGLQRVAVQDIEVLPGGRILALVGTTAVTPPNVPNQLVMVDTSGQLDSTFGDGGIFTPDYDPAVCVDRKSMQRFAVGNDGTISVYAFNSCVSDGSRYIGLLSDAGDMIDTFGSDGWVEFPDSAGLLAPVAVDDAGRVLVHRYSPKELVRFGSDGTIDPTFTPVPLRVDTRPIDGPADGPIGGPIDPTDESPYGENPHYNRADGSIVTTGPGGSVLFYLPDGTPDPLRPPFSNNVQALEWSGYQNLSFAPNGDIFASGNITAGPERGIVLLDQFGKVTADLRYGTGIEDSYDFDVNSSGKLHRLDFLDGRGLVVTRSLLTADGRLFPDAGPGWLYDPSPSRPVVQDPINTASGALVMDKTDLPSPGGAPMLDWSRSYDSTRPTAGPLGQGWVTSWDARLDQRGPQVVFINEHGAEFAFDRSGATGFDRPDGLLADLTETANGFTLGWFDGSEWDFNYDGRLESKSDWTNNGVNVERDPAGRIGRLVATTGHEFSFAYESTPTGDRLTGVVAADGRQVLYSYDANGSLTSVTNPTDTTTYTHDSDGRIVSEADGTGIVVHTTEYDTDSRVARQILATGEITEFAYDAEQRSTTVTDLTTGEAVTYRFDSSANLESITDPAGNVSAIGWNADVQPVGSTDRLGYSPAVTYDDRGNLTSSTDPVRGTTTYTFDIQNRMTAMAAPTGAVTTMGYTGGERIPSTVTDALGNTTTYTIGDGLVTATTDADGVATSYTYDGQRQMVEMTNGIGATWTYTRDAVGRQTSSTTPLGHASTRSFDSAGRVLTSTAADGGTTTYTYDADGRVLSTTDPVGAVIANTYDPATGLLDTTTDPAGRVTSYAYDDLGQLTSVTTNDGAVSETDYGLLGRVVASRDPLGREITYSYDADGNQTEVAAPDGGVTRTEFDTAGRISAMEDPIGRRTTHTYDDSGRLLNVTRPDGTQLSYTYDLLDRQIETIAPDGGITATAFTAAGRTASITDPEGGVTSYAYDAAGQMNVVTDPNGFATTLEYDPDGRRTAVITPEGLVTNWEYDPMGRITKMIDPAGIELAMEYTLRGELAREQRGGDGSVNYVYNPDGTLASVSDALGNTSTFDYDTVGRETAAIDVTGAVETMEYNDAGELISQIDRLGRVTGITYDANGRVDTVSDPSGRTTNHVYDTAGQLLNQTFGGGSTIGYVYDDLGRRTEMTDPTGTTAYTYDVNGRPTVVSTESGTLGYTYDLAGRRTGLTYPDGTTVTYTYDPAGRLTGLTDPDTGDIDYTFDDDGRLILTELPTGDTRAFNFVNGQLVRHEDHGRTTDLTYDDAGRIATLAGAQNHTYTYDNAGQLTQAAQDEGTYTYTYGQRGEITSISDPDRSRTFEHNANVEITSILDSDGNTGGAVYDDAGRIVEHTDPDGTVTTYDYDDRGLLIETVITTPADTTGETDACVGLTPTIIGTNGDDVIQGTWQDDIIFGLDGDDTITGASGADIICGGPGNDNISGQSQDDIIYGGPGNDTITGDSGADTINGGSGNDTLDGNSQNDTINGDDGDDTINGGAGDDTLDGGNGNDVVDGSWQTDSCDDAEQAISCETITTDGEAPTTGGQAGSPITCNGLTASIVGTDGDDTLVGTWQDDVIVALAGNDTITGASGNDTICAGPGNDIIDGQSGADTIVGEEGNDQITGASGADLIDGGPGNDFITGNSQSDTIQGGDGDDNINGGADNDNLAGGPGTDTIDGSWQLDDCSAETVTACESNTGATEQFTLLGTQFTQPETPAPTMIVERRSVDGTGHLVQIDQGTSTEGIVDFVWDRAQAASQIVTWIGDGAEKPVVYGAGRELVGPDTQINTALGDEFQIDPAQTTPYGPTTAVAGPSFGYRGELELAGSVHLRARDLDPALAGFRTRDPLTGVAGTPTVATGFHYADNDPVNRRDPLGLRPSDVGMLPWFDFGPSLGAVAIVDERPQCWGLTGDVSDLSSLELGYWTENDLVDYKSTTGEEIRNCTIDALDGLRTFVIGMAPFGGCVNAVTAAFSDDNVSKLDIVGCAIDAAASAGIGGIIYKTARGNTVFRPVRNVRYIDDVPTTRPGRSTPAPNTTSSASVPGANTTRTGVTRNNPTDWRRTRDIWDNAGLSDVLSPGNRKSIASGRSPVVDDAWVRHFPGDNTLIGEKISPHHLGGGPITAPLPATRHLDAHMPGGFRYNPGGPGATG